MTESLVVFWLNSRPSYIVAESTMRPNIVFHVSTIRGSAPTCPVGAVPCQCCHQMRRGWSSRQTPQLKMAIMGRLAKVRL